MVNNYVIAMVVFRLTCNYGGKGKTTTSEVQVIPNIGKSYKHVGINFFIPIYIYVPELYIYINFFYIIFYFFIFFLDFDLGAFHFFWRAET